VMHRHLRENRDVAARFLVEARAAARLEHPCIVEIYDVSDDDDEERFLVVELLRGSTLRALLERCPELPPEIAAVIVARLSDALAHAHEAGVVHRDVKPENVLVEVRSPRSKPAPSGSVESVATESSLGGPLHPESASPVPPAASSSPRMRSTPGSATSHASTAAHGSPGVRIKLTDFGIAKVLDGHGHTHTGQILGSPSYMAPEQIEGGDIDARTDVFALGVVLYECLVGRLPFDGKNPAQILRKVLDGEYVPPEQARPVVGAAWSGLCCRALARNPADRIASASDLARALYEELDSLGFGDMEAELAAFVSDPAAYAESHERRLLQRLVARAEQRTACRDVVGSAADWNRALALAPSDSSLLAKAAGAARAGRRRWVRAGAAVGLTVAFLAVGVVAWRPWASAARSHQGGAQAPMGDEAWFDEGAPLDDEFDAPAADVPPGAVAPAAKRAPRLPGVLLPHRSARPAPAGPRKVRFQVSPPGARLRVDGGAVSWLTDAPTLSVGSHGFSAEIDSKCCRAKEGSFVVAAAPRDAPDQVQTVAISLDLLPATISFAGGPPGAQLTCLSAGVTLTAGETKLVPMTDVRRTVQCQASSPGAASPQPVSVTLRAGESVVAPFPAAGR
jgi:serine/threonine protein kinase